MLVNQSESPMKVFISTPLYIYHTLMVLSDDPEAKYSLFGKNSKLITLFEWPLKVLMS